MRTHIIWFYIIWLLWNDWVDNGNRVPMKQMIVQTRVNDNFVKNILDKYYLKVVKKTVRRSIIIYYI